MNLPESARFQLTPDGTRQGFGSGLADPPAVTPYRVIYEGGKLSLRHYAAVGRGRRVPVLLIYSLLKRPFILDLQRGVSVVEHLTRKGFEVFLTDWMPPTRNDSWRGFEAYVNQDLAQAVRAVQAHQQVPQVSILGYCLGGLLGLLYTALHPQNVNALVTLATPVDMGFRALPISSLFGWLDERAVDSLVDFYGNCPPWLIRAFFSTPAPVNWMLDHWFGLAQYNERERYARLSPAFRLWLESDVPIAGALFRELIVDILKKNLLARGAFRVGDKLVNHKSIGCPLLNVVAEFDAVVHPRSSLPLIDFAAGEDKSNLTFPTGHLGIAASSEAHAKLWPEIASWLKKIGLPSSGGGHLKKIRE